MTTPQPPASHTKTHANAPAASDAELFSLMREKLYSPVLGDILDQFGRYHQILPAPVKPLRENMILAGRAMPALMIDVFGPQKTPFGKLTAALDDLREGEVYIAAGGAMRCAYWGELLTATARTRGAAAPLWTAIIATHRKCSRKTGPCSAAAPTRRIRACAHKSSISAAPWKSPMSGSSRATLCSGTSMAL